jgi:hypothetical protein
MLDARFAETVAGAARPAGWPPFALPGSIAATLEEAARREACPPPVVDYYTRRMPAMLVEQQTPADETRARLWRELGKAPRLRAALEGLYRALAEEGIDARRFLGAHSAGELLAARPSVAALYARTMFGSGLPLLGAWPAERELLARELDDEDSIDRRLSGNLVHELCHGPAAAHAERPTPWMIAEAAALTLGARAFARHLFPEEPGEAVPGVSLFVCLGSALRRRFPGFLRILDGAPLSERVGEAAARALEAAAWQDWLARREPPFARDALSAMAWIKLAEAPLSGEDLLARAAATPWSELSWWRESNFSLEEVEEAVGALFQVNRMAPTFQTHPDELPGGRLWLDVAACTLSAERRSDGVFAEPAWWLVPPPMARRLWERGARRLRVDGARREDRRAIAAALFELAQDNQPLPEEPVLTWTSSR